MGMGQFHRSRAKTVDFLLVKYFGARDIFFEVHIKSSLQFQFCLNSMFIAGRGRVPYKVRVI